MAALKRMTAVKYLCERIVTLARNPRPSNTPIWHLASHCNACRAPGCLTALSWFKVSD